MWYTEKKSGNKITGFIIHWSTGNREAAATDKQLSLLRQIHDEVQRRFYDYISLKNKTNLEVARLNVLKIRDINKQVNDTLTVDKAKDLIAEAKSLYEQLQAIVERDGKTRDTSFYYNWLEEK